MIRADDPEEYEEIDTEEDAEARAFGARVIRLLIHAVLGYLVGALILTVISLLTGTHWWVLGWGWPILAALGFVIGSSLDAWAEKE